ncbi:MULTISPECIES: phosphoribosyltransferase domain-containing protein [unclassified Acinetobacter]|uniref:phosphoribosyltransferase domain-containing protein n=1 Tax=unclassified Acinetobacter TaxID=196816 RepID=UPI0035B70FE1
MPIVQLNRGTLTLQPTSHHPDWQVNDLLDYAERINPKRAFLFVSKVLGRHIPVSPSVIRHAFSDLANLVPNDLPEPVLVIGMAETAVGLGAGVHQVLQQRYPQAIYLTTTRHPVENTQLLAEFLEEHSHAQDQLLYSSNDAELQHAIMSAKSLILVDDEASTGKTFVNLVNALQQAGLNQLQHIVSATLVDWSKGIQIDGLNCQSVALLKGDWSWQDSDTPIAINMPKVDSIAKGDYPCMEKPTWGRIATKNTLYLANLADKLQNIQADEKILVLGTGEYVWSPFLLAEYLQKQGADVKFSAITRSPIALGHAIKSSLAFHDSYGLGIQNFVYNVNADDYDRILICVETTPNSVAQSLLDALPNAVVVSSVEFPLISC